MSLPGQRYRTDSYCCGATLGLPLSGEENGTATCGADRRARGGRSHCVYERVGRAGQWIQQRSHLTAVGRGADTVVEWAPKT